MMSEHMTHFTPMRSFFRLKYEATDSLIGMVVNIHAFCISVLLQGAARKTGPPSRRPMHRVYDNMLQRAQKCIDVQGDHFQHLL
jgi:hypothetical protein